MTPQTFLESLLALSDPADQHTLICEHLDLFTDQGAAWIKDQIINHYRLEDTQKALQIAKALVTAGQLRQSVRCQGYGLWAKAVTYSLGLGDYDQALALYAEAIAIFAQANDAVSIARMQISQIWALTNVNRIAEAFTAGASAAATLEAAGELYLLAILRMNLASIYSRTGDDAKAAVMYEGVQHAYEALAPMDRHVESNWALAVQNRAISLFYLGKFAEAIQSAQLALTVHERLGNRLEATRTRQLLGMVHFMMGHYNKGLRLLDEVRTVFWADGSLRHTARVDLYICDCLLHLGRSTAVLDKIQQLRNLFRQLHSPHEEGLAVLYEASAYVGKRQLELALNALDEARSLFVLDQNPIWIANSDLAKAHLLFQQQRDRECLAVAQACVTVFSKHQLAAAEAETNLLIPQALMRAGQQQEAFALLQETKLNAVIQNVPTLAVTMHQAVGRLAVQNGTFGEAYQAYAQAITALEYLRGQMMVEHRITFQSDKQTLYEEMVSLCLQMGQVQDAFGYVERVKSRALLELIDNRIDLRIEVRNEADRPLVERLLQLRSDRDRLYRQSYDMEQGNERGWLAKPQDEEKQQEILRLEKEIGELWHSLLIRNADYTQDAVLHNVLPTNIQPDLDTDTILLEYFAIQERLLVFLVTQDGMTAFALDTPMAQIKSLIERLRRHMQSISRFPIHQLTALEKQAQFLLHELYKYLLAPVVEQIRCYSKLLIVPHDTLHYLPFHALYDGHAYLLERFEISYLPNAALWQHLHRQQSVGEGALAIGCSAAGQLPHTRSEAQRLADLFQGDLLLEEAATRQQTCRAITGKRLLHFATHAVCDSEQPLFSGLLLADGWLTAFDVFNLQLQADLVTLSACQTGQSVLGGGDELLGLLRAFFYAGAKALVASLWAVEDQATARLMAEFYTNLQQPITKSAALRNAQLALCRSAQLSSSTSQAHYTHPYFWASFFLTGNTNCFHK